MTKIFIVAIALGIILGAGHSTYAQQNGSQLNKLWIEVTQSYPGLDAKEAIVASARLDEKSVIGARLPQLRLQAQNSYATYEGISGAFFPQPGLFNVSGTQGLLGPSYTFNSYASSTFEWELFSFGKNKYKSKAAQSKTRSTESEMAAYLLQLQKELAQRYLQVLYYETKLEKNQANLKRLHNIRRMTTGLAKAGLRSAADSLLASSSYHQALGDNEHLKGKKQAAILQLMELTNEKEADYNASIPTFLMPLNGSVTSKNEINPDHPVLQSLDHQRDRLENQGKSEARSALPSINLIAGVAYRGVGITSDGSVSDPWKDGFSNTVTNSLVGVGMTWNISDLYTKTQHSHSLKKQAESKSHRLQQYKQQMRAELDAIQQQVSHQYVEVQKTSKAQHQANEAYQMYLSRYKSGLMDLSNLLQIQILLEQAELKHLNAAHNFWNLKASESELIADFSHLFNNL